jgi:acetyl-CoA carboxylase biotin carboxylase subunit
MGDKIEAKRTAAKLGMPLVPGSDGGGRSVAEALAIARGDRLSGADQGAAGGGGRGMKVAHSEPTSCSSLAPDRASEAKAAFGDDTVYLENISSEPRHIEIQVLGDGKGNARSISASATARCSAATRRSGRKPLARAHHAERATRSARLVAKAMREMMGYRGAGTIEFLYEDGEFYFIEMNTRLQVEHPVTEMITGIDLVREQIRVAAGGGCRFTQDEVELPRPRHRMPHQRRGPETFAPSPGLVKNYVAPGGMHVRVDSGLYAGYKVPPYYDSMIGKLIVYGTDPRTLHHAPRRALEEFVVEGMKTTIPLHS